MSLARLPLREDELLQGWLETAVGMEKESIAFIR
jgi:hypothetical protein